MKRKLIYLIALTIVFTMVAGIVGLSPDKAGAAPVFEKISFTNATVKADYLNVRQATSTKAPIVCVIKKGQTVKVFGKIGDWYAIYEPAKSCVGVVRSIYLKTTATVPPAKPPVATAKPPVATAKPPAATAKPPVATAKPPVATTKPPSATTAPPSGISADEQKLLDLTNKARADAGLGALSFDMGVVKTARLKAQDMVNNNYFSHQSPTYGSPFDMMRQFGVTFKTAGENIAGNQSVQGAFTAWMNSPGHKANILNGSFTHVGFGIVPSPTYGLMLVQQFIGK